MPEGKTELDHEVIMSEAMDWLSEWTKKYFDIELKAITADGCCFLTNPPTLLDAFKAGWCCHIHFDTPPSEKSEIEKLKERIEDLKATCYRLNRDNDELHKSNHKIGLLIEILRIPDLNIEALTEFVKKQQP